MPLIVNNTEHVKIAGLCGVVFSGNLNFDEYATFLAERCNCIASSAIPIRCFVCLSSVYLSSVTRVYCEKMAEARIMQFSLKCSPMSKLFAATFDYEI